MINVMVLVKRTIFKDFSVVTPTRLSEEWEAYHRIIMDAHNGNSENYDRDYIDTMPEENLVSRTPILVSHEGLYKSCFRFDLKENKELVLRLVSVFSLYQGSGVGRISMDIAKYIAKENGLRSIFLHAANKAIPFYISCGFNEFTWNPETSERDNFDGCKQMAFFL